LKNIYRLARGDPARVGEENGSRESVSPRAVGHGKNLCAGVFALSDARECWPGVERKVLGADAECVAGCLHDGPNAEAKVKRSTRFDERAEVRYVSVLEQAEIHGERENAEEAKTARIGRARVE
jgi:hypothetical protein